MTSLPCNCILMCQPIETSSCAQADYEPAYSIFDAILMARMTACEAHCNTSARLLACMGRRRLRYANARPPTLPLSASAWSCKVPDTLGWQQTDDNDRPKVPPIIKSTEVIWNPFEDIVPRTTPEEKLAAAAAQKCAHACMPVQSTAASAVAHCPRLPVTQVFWGHRLVPGWSLLRGFCHCHGPDLSIDEQLPRRWI